MPVTQFTSTASRLNYQTSLLPESWKCIDHFHVGCTEMRLAAGLCPDLLDELKCFSILSSHNGERGWWRGRGWEKEDREVSRAWSPILYVCVSWRRMARHTKPFVGTEPRPHMCSQVWPLVCWSTESTCLLGGVFQNRRVLWQLAGDFDFSRSL